MTKLLPIECAEARHVLDRAYRNDLALFTERAFYEVNAGQDFVHNWHFEAIAYRLNQVARGEIKRLLITMPPRSLKSHSASVAFPAWVLGHNPMQRIICVSYSNDLATAHAGSFRKIIAAPWYHRLFPEAQIDVLKDTETETRLQRGGYRLTTTIGGSLTGRGGSIIVIDDPMKAADAHSETVRNRVKTWYDETLLSRLDNKKTGAIVLVMQRLHIDDLAGHVLARGDWTHLDLPAISEVAADIPIGPTKSYHRPEGELLHAAREGMAELNTLKTAMGTQAFAAQYQQTPVPLGGNMVRYEWFKRYDSVPNQKDYQTKIVQSWDTASKSGELNDYSVGITALLRKDVFYILDVQRAKLDYPDLKRKIVQTAKHWHVDTVLIEDKGSGTSLIQDLRSDNVYPKGIKPEGDKVVRMSACTAQIEAGQVLLPKEAPWLGEFQAELLAFPHGRYDDQADALSQMLNWNRTRSRYTLENI